MTGFMNTAPDGDPALQGHPCVPLAEVDPGLTPAPPPDPEAGRSEVAARLARYRTRRKPRAPRYPSLLLPFDSSDNWSRSAAAIASPSLAAATTSDPHFPLQQVEIPQEVSFATPFSPDFSPHAAGQETPSRWG